MPTTTNTCNVNQRNLPPLISVKDAVSLGVGSERYVRLACERGEIRAVKAGKVWRINSAALLAQFGLQG